MLEVTVFDVEGRVKAIFADDADLPEGYQPNEVKIDGSVDFISLVNSGTYGPPALVAPGPRSDSPRASVGDRVLFINTSIVPMFDAIRVSD